MRRLKRTNFLNSGLIILTIFMIVMCPCEIAATGPFIENLGQSSDSNTDKSSIPWGIRVGEEIVWTYTSLRVHNELLNSTTTLKVPENGTIVKKIIFYTEGTPWRFLVTDLSSRVPLANLTINGVTGVKHTFYAWPLDTNWTNLAQFYAQWFNVSVQITRDDAECFEFLLVDDKCHNPAPPMLYRISKQRGLLVHREVLSSEDSWFHETYELITNNQTVPTSSSPICLSAFLGLIALALLHGNGRKDARRL